MHKEYINKITQEYLKILGENLVGVYLHGSIAFGCYNSQKSDMDFLIVVKDFLSQQQKVSLIQILLDLTAASPINGFEMSVVLEKYCNNFIYPTPYELHFSNAHLQGFTQNLEEYCKAMNGTDKDLAAHFTVINKAGITIYGKEISNVFGNVPKEAYLDSIKYDVDFNENEIADHPVYVILNLCRAVAFIEDNIVISKKQGGIWGIKNVSGEFSTLIQNILDVYCHNKEISIDLEMANRFNLYMRNRIFNENHTV